MKKTLRERAKAGETQAQVTLAFLHELGVDRTKSLPEAKKWWLAAAKQGHAWAQYRLSKLYQTEESGKKDAFAAEDWLRKAQDSGFELPEQARRQVVQDRSKQASQVYVLAKLQGDLRPLTDGLQAFGHTIHGVEDGEVFLRVAEARLKEADILIIDFDHMEKNLAAIVRLATALQPRPAIFVTAHVSASHKFKPLPLDGWIAKPLDLRKAIVTLEPFLNRPKGGR